MAIDVTCPGCKQRFQVSDKFAGKKGPCPKCKFVITVPEKSAEVVIHAPEVTGPKDSKGQAVLKPITRTEVRLSRPVIAGIIGAVVAVLLVAVVLRVTAPKPGQIAPLITFVGAILLAPALAFAGYTFLRDDELEPHRGKTLLLRLIAPSVVYPLIWGIYWFVVVYVGVPVPPNLIFMGITVVAAIAIGAVTAQASLDLEFGQGALHYTMYLVTTVILRLIMGMNAFWQLYS